jgi:hypothetical protein
MSNQQPAYRAFTVSSVRAKTTTGFRSALHSCTNQEMDTTSCSKRCQFRTATGNAKSFSARPRETKRRSSVHSR